LAKRNTIIKPYVLTYCATGANSCISYSQIAAHYTINCHTYY